MDGISLIQDLAIVLLAAGIAGTLCRRFGLSVIVGYLVAGIVIGPYTPPFSFLQDVDRIQTLSQVGLVFLMFGIGLGLSLGRLGRMGWPTLLATALGAIFVLILMNIVGVFTGWSGNQALFIAAMCMCSSSAVIAKIAAELNLTHERTGQLALSITVLEDIVAVVMLTILGSQTRGGEGEAVSTVLATMSAFVVLLAAAGLLMVPRLMRRLEARADPELQTIVVGGLLFLLALTAVKAGYSLALGAFLLGAIVAELPQKTSVERSFSGMRDVFSSVFFVSIGMMIDFRLILPAWPLVLGLVAFVIVGRPLATGLALTLVGSPPREARRAGLLLTPMGEFTYIIAQLGVATAVLPPSYYPVAVGVSILTVLLVPTINRHADTILEVIERLEPRWVMRAFEAYHGWIEHVRMQPTRSIAWKLTKGRLLQSGVEALLVTGVMLFAPALLELLKENVSAAGLEVDTLRWVFWGAVAAVVLILLVAIWRNLAAISMIVAESVSGARLPAAVVRSTLQGLWAILIGIWLYALVPFDQLGGWGWAIVGVAAAIVVGVFSHKLVYWHSQWQSSVRDVLAEDAAAVAANRAETARGKRAQDLEQWELRLRDVVVPDAAEYGGQTLAQLAIPARYGCAILEFERNGHVITAIRPDLRVYPGDKILLLGGDGQLAAAAEFFSRGIARKNETDEFQGSVLETASIPERVWNGRTLADLQLSKLTGVRVVGIERHGRKLIAPGGEERLEAGDNVLVAGTLAEINQFRRWLKTSGEERPAEEAASA